jgi:hypothetical protein
MLGSTEAGILLAGRLWIDLEAKMLDARSFEKKTFPLLGIVTISCRLGQQTLFRVVFITETEYIRSVPQSSPPLPALSGLSRRYMLPPIFTVFNVDTSPQPSGVPDQGGNAHGVASSESTTPELEDQDEEVELGISDVSEQEDQD